MSSPIQSARPAHVRPPVVSTPSVERYIEHSLKYVGKIRNLEAMVMLYDVTRDGKMDPGDKQALKEALKKHADVIEPAAASLMRQAAGLEKKKERTPYDVQLVREYFGYVRDPVWTGGDADYLLATARAIGGSKDVKSYVAAQVKNHPEKFDADAKAKLLAFAKEGSPAVGKKNATKTADKFQ